MESLNLKVIKNDSKYSFIDENISNAKTYIPPLFEKDGIRLYMNENLYGPSAKCFDVLKLINLNHYFKYAEGGNYFIENKIAETLGLTYDYITANNGSSDVLKLIFDIVVNKGDDILLPNPGWSYYTSEANVSGANIHKYNLSETKKSYSFNSQHIVQQIKNYKPKMVIITSPNMPTGNMIEEEDLEYILDNYSSGVLVLDEAYFGFSKKRYDIKKMIKKYDNFVIVRTFSKLYGLAGIRIGYLISSPKIKEIMIKKSPLFGISTVSQMIASAALDDTEYYENLSNTYKLIKDNFIKEVNKRPQFKCFESEANFVLIKTKGIDVSKFTEFLKLRNYLIRDCKGYGLSNCIRISIGKEEHMNEIIRLLDEYIKS